MSEKTMSETTREENTKHEKKSTEKKQKIIAFMHEEVYRPLLLEELVMVLDVPKTSLEDFREMIQELEQQGKIFKTHRNRFGIPERMSLIVGRFQGNERGFGFAIPDEDDTEDIFIPAEALNGVMHGDRIIARVNKKSRDGKRSEGEIIRILVRANKTIVGTFENSRSFGFVVPDNPRICGDVFISKEELNGAKQGQKVVAEIVKFPDKRRNAEGRIIEILGDKFDKGTDILSIVKSYGLSEEFPQEVLAQAESISEIVTPDMAKGRRDLRGLSMVTIDGEDAKDLDDAVSVELLENDNFRLGVHIADVSYYVKENSPLDREAYNRGTSVYLVDRVIPMLPKKLSNGICSLNPKIDRLAFTAMMDIDRTGKVVSHEIFDSIINIDERMTYTNVYKILEEQDAELILRYKPLMPQFNLMKELALILKSRRNSKGAIDFDFPETKVVLDDDGNPIEIKKYEITFANQIIEEFMLCCNETVAEHYFWANTPFVYRIHEDPDPEKIETFSNFAKSFGYHLKGLGKVHPKAMQELISKVKGSKEERIISTVMLRSLKKARYSPNNDGHFGLAAKFYCHFTSPIRRYPDLMIHRIMKEQIKGKMIGAREEFMQENLPEITRQCSERERGAEEAERSSKDLKKVQYMKKHLGEEFEGIISNVVSFGIFIELPNTIEGMVKLSSLEDDYYVYDETRYCLVGERNKRIFKIGDEVKVIVARVDMAMRQIEFVISMDSGNARSDQNTQSGSHVYTGSRKIDGFKHSSSNQPAKKSNTPKTQKERVHKAKTRRKRKGKSE